MDSRIQVEEGRLLDCKGEKTDELASKKFVSMYSFYMCSAVFFRGKDALQRMR